MMQFDQWSTAANSASVFSIDLCELDHHKHVQSNRFE